MVGVSRQKVVQLFAAQMGKQIGGPHSLVISPNRFEWFAHSPLQLLLGGISRNYGVAMIGNLGRMLSSRDQGSVLSSLWTEERMSDLGLMHHPVSKLLR